MDVLFTLPPPVILFFLDFFSNPHSLLKIYLYVSCLQEILFHNQFLFTRTTQIISFQFQMLPVHPYAVLNL